MLDLARSNTQENEQELSADRLCLLNDTCYKRNTELHVHVQTNTHTYTYTHAQCI